MKSSTSPSLLAAPPLPGGGAGERGVLRYAAPEEAPLVIALMRQQYGASYKKEFYDSAALARRIEERSLRFLLALEDGNAAGVIGADADSVFADSDSSSDSAAVLAPAPLQYILLVVDAAYRGRGLGKALFRRILEDTRLEQWSCVYGYCVTVDTVSQRFHAEAGFKMTGMLLNRYFFDQAAPNTALALKTPGLSLPVKRSNIILCLPGAKKDAGVLYAPEKLRPRIAKVYASLGASFSFGAGCVDAGSVDDQGKYHIDNDRDQEYCEVYVRRAGKDFAALLETLLGTRGGGNYTFNAFININDPAAAVAFATLERAGFFFTGVQALSGGEEYIVAHRHFSYETRFDAIQAHPAFAGGVREIQEWYERRNK